ncbi:MAG TPA: FecR family protein [Stellaceae bacterium]|nr:FecR family protein [Stellaceae bacterium]
MPIDRISHQAQAVPDALLEEAAVWNVRLHDPAAGHEQRAGFARWLAADPRNAAAYAEMERLWAALEAPAKRVLAAETAVASPLRPKRRLSPSWRWGAVAACLLLAVCSGLAWKGSLLDDLRSDYVTAVGVRRALTLADGSQVILNTDSALAVSFAPDRRAVRLFRGEAWFNVTHDAGRSFVVETPEGTVQVTGTQFNVRIVGGRVIVSLLEGKVALASANPRASRRDLIAGQQTAMTDAGIDAPAEFDAAAVTAWQHGQLVFYKAPLKQVVAQLNRYREGRVVVANDELRDLKVTGVFDTTDTDAALSVIQSTLHVRVFRLTNYLVLLR